MVFHRTLAAKAILSSQMYSYGYKLINSTIILQINPKSSYITPIDYLRYFYYSALICIGVRDYTVAIDNLLQVITTPAMVLSAIVIHAIKKIRLLSLIESGVLFTMPKSNAVSSIVSKYFKQPSPVYDSICNAFQSNNLELLKKLLEQNTDVLNKDSNLGIALQLPDSLIRHRIRNLATTYMTLSLQDIANSVGLSNALEVEVRLLSMIESDNIAVRIDSMTGMVHFDDGCDNDDSTHIILQLQANLNQSMILYEELYKLQKSVLTSSEYISKVSGSSSSSSSMGISGNMSWHDEDDMMDMSSMGTII
eukprot:gene1282-2474_t